MSYFAQILFPQASAGDFIFDAFIVAVNPDVTRLCCISRSLPDRPPLAHNGIIAVAGTVLSGSAW
jgi:hypothetical protein